MFFYVQLLHLLILKKVFLFITVLFLVFSCKDKEPENIAPEKVKPQKAEQFGFDFNNFNVFNIIFYKKYIHIKLNE